MVSGIEGRGFHTEYRVCGDDGEHRDCSPSGNHKRNQIGTGGNFAAVSRIRGNSRRRPAMLAGSRAEVCTTHRHESATFPQLVLSSPSTVPGVRGVLCVWGLQHWGGRVADGLVSREAAKGNAGGSVRCSVRRAADGSPRVCDLLRCEWQWHPCSTGGNSWAHAKPRSREGKRRGKCSVLSVRCSVWRAADGSPRVGSFRSSGFPARAHC